MDGVRNPRIQSVFLDRFPIFQAAFAGGGSHVIATARRSHFYVFDLASAAVEKVRSSFSLAVSAATHAQHDAHDEASTT